MSDGVLTMVLLILALSVALNLKLTFSLLATVRALADGPPVPLQAGMPLPPVCGRALLGRADVALPVGQRAGVLLFLSSQCPQCRTKLPEIEGMLAPARMAGVDMFLVSQEPAWRLRRFLHPAGLAPIALRLGRKDYRQLNPRLMSPAYVFVGHDGIVQASGMIGDDDWRSFCAQMDEARQEAA
jgi:hypothetical protein